MEAAVDRILDECLGAFVKAGTLSVSLDKLADEVGVSKRMLIHYFGGKSAIEESATARLEDRLRTQFRAAQFPAGSTLAEAVSALWRQTTDPRSRGVLLLAMDLNRRAWDGSERAQSFYREQQRLWVEMLLEFSPDRDRVEAVLTLFQGAVLMFLATGDGDRGTVLLDRFLAGGK